ncbi:MAG TPA: helix-turn-helix transcriptional regulator, partial [Feifaniaceae bacterium]|nr:helix-turn-helix transcriptional regulator [Feifaniaceae bacterium]
YYTPFISILQTDRLVTGVNKVQKTKGLNDRRYIQIGLKIAYYRKMNGMTQEQLAELAGISSGYLSQVETPTLVQPISLKTLFAIADLLHIPPAKFLEFEEP